MMTYTKQQKELATLVALIFAAGLVWFFFVGKGSGTPTGPAGPGAYRPIDAQDYSVVLDRLKKAQSTEYKPSGRNIFIAAPVKPVDVAPAAPVEPPHLTVGPVLPPPPPPPQLAMKFFGYGTLPSGGRRQAFLLDGDEVKIVSEGDTIQNHIRIVHIGNDRIEFEDTNTGMRNSVVLEMPPST
jgi:hypothetical protein